MAGVGHAAALSAARAGQDVVDVAVVVVVVEVRQLQALEMRELPQVATGLGACLVLFDGPFSSWNEGSRYGRAYDVARNSLQNCELVRLSYWINARKQLSRLQLFAPATAARRETDVTRLMKCIFRDMR